MNYIYLYIYTSVCIRHISAINQPISAIDMTLWLSQPKGAQSGHEAKGWRSANRLVELRDATKLLGSAVDAMVYHGVPVAKTWTIGYKYGVFLGEII